MSLHKKPALRRNYSEERVPKPKDCSLPHLVKGLEYASSHQAFKRYNLEPFKLRVNNAQERRTERGTESPPCPRRPEREDVGERAVSPLRVIDR